MRIDALCPPQQPKGRWKVVFDDGTVLKIPAVVAADEGLYKNKELSEEDFRQLKAAAGEASAKERAVRIISAADVSEADLKRRLTEKGETPQDAETAIEWLNEMKLLDDRRVAAQIVSRGISHVYGKNRIKQLLYEKQIPREYWEEALSQIPDMGDEIDRFLQQKLKGMEPDKKELDRVIAALVRRGHNWSDIQAALSRYRDNLASS